MPALPRKRSRDGATTDWGGGFTAHLSTPREWKAELAWLADLQRTVYPHSGHPSTAGRAQDRVSSPAKDRRSANCATQPEDKADGLKISQNGPGYKANQSQHSDGTSTWLTMAAVTNTVV